VVRLRRKADRRQTAADEQLGQGSDADAADQSAAAQRPVGQSPEERRPVEQRPDEQGPGEGGPVEPASDKRGEAAPDSAALRARGPWDVAEVEVDEDDESKVDLGGLIVTGRPGLELRLQVDQASEQVASVLLVGAEGAVELRPFAAPRHGDIWPDVREAMIAEAGRRGGTATEAEGAWGVELRVVVPMAGPDGKPAPQVSRVFGIPGPRWLLRATLLGKPALEPHEDGIVESALRDVIVVRGSAPMAPGDPLPLTMPSDARPQRPEPRPAQPDG
jgi:hypothetical protein